MALALTIKDHWEDGKRVHIIATLTASGSYVTGGDSVTLTDPLIKSASAPTLITVQAAGFNCVGLPGALNSSPPSGKVQFFIDTTGLEVAAGAYPVALSAALIQLYAIFPKHI